MALKDNNNNNTDNNNSNITWRQKRTRRVGRKKQLEING